MVTRGTPRQQLDDVLPGLGIAIGAGAGMALGVAIAGGPGIAFGAAVGGSAGVVAGAAVQALRSRLRHSSLGATDAATGLPRSRTNAGLAGPKGPRLPGAPGRG